MRDRFVLGVVGCAVLAAAALPGVAGAAKGSTHPTRHHLTATAMLVTLSSTRSFPAPGSSQVVLALGHSTPGGKAVAVNYLTITSAHGLVFGYKGTTVDYYAEGSLRSTFAGSFTAHADGSIIATGKGQFAGGTGAFRRATGTYTFAGTQPAGSAVLADHSTGTLTY